MTVQARSIQIRLIIIMNAFYLISFCLVLFPFISIFHWFVFLECILFQFFFFCSLFIVELAAFVFEQNEALRLPLYTVLLCLHFFFVVFFLSLLCRFLNWKKKNVWKNGIFAFICCWYLYSLSHFHFATGVGNTHIFLISIQRHEKKKNNHF